VKRGTSFFGAVWNSFSRVQGFLGGAAAITLAVLLWLIAPSRWVSLAVVVPVGVLMLFIIAALVDTAVTALRAAGRELPAVVAVMAQADEDTQLPVLLLEPSVLFSHDTAVSIYYLRDGYEMLLALGAVVNVQDDGRIQVRIARTFEGQSDVLAKLTDNNKAALENTRVKPYLPRQFMIAALPPELQEDRNPHAEERHP
jgi:hypothetical protein